MLTTIVQHLTELVAFITALNIVLYQPQMRHLLQMMDALLVSNDTKTISGLYRLLKWQPDPKNGADFLTVVHSLHRIKELPPADKLIADSVQAEDTE